MTKLCEVFKNKQINKAPAHVKEIVNYLIELKFENIEIHLNNHYKATWVANGRRYGVSFSSTPTNPHAMLNIVKRDIRRTMRG